MRTHEINHALGDEEWLSKAALSARHRAPTRTAAFYRFHELEAFAPSERASVLREVLQAADEGVCLARTLLLSLLCAASVALLVPQPWQSAQTALGVACAFGLCYLLVRRENVRRLLRQRLHQERLHSACVACEWAEKRSAWTGIASLSRRVTHWARFCPWG
ncbi:MAG TPA: hypothetical protein VGP22_18280 [Albitalea sp.]|nr:hypothetical protein [Albitalea sp.]